MGPRAVPQPPPGRLRRRPTRRCTARCSRPPTAATIVELPGGELRARRAAPPPPLMLAALHTLADPWSDPIMRRALLEVVLLGVVGGRARLLDRLLRALLQRRVARARAVPRPRRWRRCSGIPLLLGGAAGLLVAALAIAPPAGCRRSAATPRSRWSSRRSSALGALLALSPASPPGLQSLLFGDVLGVRDGDLGLAAALARGRPRGARAAARAAAGGRLRPRQRAGARRASAGRRPRAARPARARRCSSPCRASATCSSSRCWSPRRPPRRLVARRMGR